VITLLRINILEELAEAGITLQRGAVEL